MAEAFTPVTFHGNRTSDDAAAQLPDEAATKNDGSKTARRRSTCADADP